MAENTAENTFIWMDPSDGKNTANSLHEVMNPSMSLSHNPDRMSPFKLCHFIENGRLSVSFQDFGRESLGILPPDFGKESLSFLNMNISENRDSCFKSILNISEYGRESLEGGRESLGILQINKLDLRLGDEDENLPEIMLTTIPENTDVGGSVLDTAFLFPSPRKALLSSISSQNSGFPSFNSCSLEEPSKIYSLSRNEAGSCISDFYSAPSDLNNAQVISPSETDEQHSGINYLPGANELHPSTDRIFWSTGKVRKSKQLLRRSFHCGKLEFYEEKEKILHDSILIEGNYIAQKIADGSILNDGCSTNLDSTPQPSWPSDLDESKTKEIDAPNIESNAIFKTIDKMLPEAQSNIDLRLKTSKVDSTPSKSKDAKEILQNLSEILSNTHRSDQQISQGQNLLTSLAEILCEGSENHVPHLDDSGHSSFIDQNDMSDKDKYDYYEILDLSKKSAESKESRSYEYISNVSVSKLAKNLMERRLSQSCSTAPSIKQMDLVDGVKKRPSSISGMESSDNKTYNSNSSAKSNDSRGSGSYLLRNISGKFKTKPGTDGKKKGPLRAMIPVQEMKRNASNIAQTPEKSQQCSSTSLQSKRTSTPINEPKLKPMAASTPTFQQVKSISGSNSKLSRASLPNDKNSLRNDKALIVQPNRSKEPSKIGTGFNSENSASDKSSTAAMSLRKSYSKLEQATSRRNSASEIKIDDIRKLKRSNSLGKETGLMSSLSKVRENLLKSPYFDIKKKGLLTETNNNGKCDVPGGVKYSGSKQMNTLPRAKKIGKENFK